MHKKTFLSKVVICLCMILLPGQIFAQTGTVNRVEPPNWWIGMNNPELQLLVHGDKIANTEVNLNYDGVELVSIVQLENPNYLFLNLLIHDHALAGTFNIDFLKDGKSVGSYKYVLGNREANSASRSGFDGSDAIYLLMPDRFANGDENNDSHPETLEKADRSNHDGRHGGDLEGIRKNLDYFKETGFTAIWMNPFLENNQPKYSYHGYAISDFYKVDPRMGTNDSFKTLVDESHNKGIKVIMDMIFNHCGAGHWWVDDLPAKDWFHQFPEFTRSNFRATTITDPNASEYDKTKMLKGWFDTNMPDLNQKNPYLATYLIQNSIWWIEFSGLDGIRMDTQPYPYKEFMAVWAEKVLEEYPEFSIVGEVWIDKASMVSYYLGGANNHDGYDSNLPHVFDFPLYYAITKAFTENNGWSEGISRLYEQFSEDFLYNRPQDLVVFMDNHDLNRIYSTYGEDMSKLKMAMSVISTVRGIPMFYYGTEIAMNGWEHDGHGHIREDFPGGWAADSRSAFEESGREDFENEAYNHISKLLQWRQTNKAVQSGSFKHFLPEDGTYVYFRYTADEAVMVIVNNTKDKKKLNPDRFAEVLDGYKSGKDVLSGSSVSIDEDIKIKGMTVRIIELKK